MKRHERAALLSPAEAARHIAERGYVYLDVRTEEEFGLGHPQGAYNLPWELETASGRAGNPDFLRVAQAVFAPDDKLVVGCRSGSRSQAASAALLALGYAQVVEQRAGFAGVRDAFGRLKEPGWEACGLPVADEAQAGRSYAELRARAGLGA